MCNFVHFFYRTESYNLANEEIDTPEPEDCHQYGDLEIFLLGLQLESILPLFQKHGVNFAMLLTMTDSDLKQVNIICALVSFHLIHT